ncbi:MAG: protein-glutamate O-methyltransferase CheR [Bryobacterales bacterium]|nr:protein-glutamate O-methyltransferase CheR [Bryobacterales bacterium]
MQNRGNVDTISPCLPAEADTGLLSTADFARLRRFAKQQIGLNLHDGKRHLADARVSKELRRLGLGSVREYFEQLEQDASGDLLSGLVDSLTTNYTSFFREPEHFQFLEATVLPMAAQWQECRIWCAASSTGEEPYSILAAWHGHEVSKRTRLKLLASDISTRVLSTAQQGVYPEDRFSPEALQRMRPILLKGRRSADGLYRVRPELRQQVEFRRLNLMHPFPFGSEFLCVFCRNAMIYFDRPTQGEVVAKLSRCLLPGGYLFVGHSESLGDLVGDLEYVRPAVYRKRGVPLANARAND